MFKGRKNKLLELERKIRPYRHAFIRVINDGPGSISYEYINNINEFGADIIRQIDYVFAGSYQIQINKNICKNINNDIQEIDIIHTTVTSLPIISSTFNLTIDVLVIGVFDFVSATNVDIEGEILVVIREFYE